MRTKSDLSFARALRSLRLSNFMATWLGAEPRNIMKCTHSSTPTEGLALALVSSRPKSISAKRRRTTSSRSSKSSSLRGPRCASARPRMWLKSSCREMRPEHSAPTLSWKWSRKPDRTLRGAAPALGGEADEGGCAAPAGLVLALWEAGGKAAKDRQADRSESDDIPPAAVRCGRSSGGAGSAIVAAAEGLLSGASRSAGSHAVTVRWGVRLDSSKSASLTALVRGRTGVEGRRVDGRKQAGTSSRCTAAQAPAALNVGRSRALPRERGWGGRGASAGTSSHVGDPRRPPTSGGGHSSVPSEDTNSPLPPLLLLLLRTRKGRNFATAAAREPATQRRVSRASRGAVASSSRRSVVSSTTAAAAVSSSASGKKAHAGGRSELRGPPLKEPKREAKAAAARRGARAVGRGPVTCAMMGGTLPLLLLKLSGPSWKEPEMQPFSERLGSVVAMARARTTPACNTMWPGP
mmetsp:Transcript_96209/g.206482  ORF Transcript_96209/g.206482 Transcript_96209/m.206482 type:complete len:465 (-) Transcript_96209:44-1438(-)